MAQTQSEETQVMPRYGPVGVSKRNALLHGHYSRTLLTADVQRYLRFQMDRQALHDAIA